MLSPHVFPHFRLLAKFKKSDNLFVVFCIEHDLAGPCFQLLTLWPIIGDEGDRISKNNWRGDSQDNYFSKFVVGSLKDFTLNFVFGSLFVPNGLLKLHLALFLDQLSALGQNKFQQYSPFKGGSLNLKLVVLCGPTK